MRKTRVSYVPESDKKASIVWPVMVIVSFLIIAILLVLLVFSYLDSINNIIEVSQIEKNTQQAKDDYENAKLELDTINDSLVTLKEELATLQNTEGTKLTFYNEMTEVNNIRTTFGQKLYTSLNTRSILKTYGDFISISETGNVSFMNSYLFDEGKATVTSNTTEMFKYLSKQIYDLLSTNNYSKYVKAVVIESHMPSGYTDDDSVLSSARAISFRKALLNGNTELQQKYATKIEVANMFDNYVIYDEEQNANNSRIEINIIIDDSAISTGIENFIKPVEEAKAAANTASTANVTNTTNNTNNANVNA